MAIASTKLIIRIEIETQTDRRPMCEGGGSGQYLFDDPEDGLLWVHSHDKISRTFYSLADARTFLEGPQAAEATNPSFLDLPDTPPEDGSNVMESNVDLGPVPEPTVDFRKGDGPANLEPLTGIYGDSTRGHIAVRGDGRFEAYRTNWEPLGDYASHEEAWRVVMDAAEREEDASTGGSVECRDDGTYHAYRQGRQHIGIYASEEEAWAAVVMRVSEDSPETEQSRSPSGPFFIRGSYIVRKFSEDNHRAVCPAPGVGGAGEDIVDLLNKGTHYDGMLAALKALLAKHIEVCEQEFCTGPHNKGWGEDEEPIRSALAAIAEAEERK